MKVLRYYVYCEKRYRNKTELKEVEVLKWLKLNKNRNINKTKTKENDEIIRKLLKLKMWKYKDNCIKIEKKHL